MAIPEKKTTISVRKSIWKELNQMKLDLGFLAIEDVIIYLLKKER